ncbi:hypothetical protein ACQKCH_07495 [Nubsella zeaxanthinifaciens]|uniref:hypothetical protein n=1 Tax=Nubsella zeaxanthinifaciens TaxID=392412 RepID=UPI003D02DEC8
MLIFKTNVDSPLEAAKIIRHLEQSLPIPIDANFDLDDCDRILRLYSTSPLEPLVGKVQELVNLVGFNAEILHDDVLTDATPKQQQPLSLQLLCSII